ncbi:MAG: glycosyltransferase [Akkermansia sp.]|nr:glycosyltransferase [Akkermansia sp.]
MADFLPRCLDSLCNQSYSNLEIICVDDGSIDGSLSILREYAAKDARIKVIHQENAGVSSARNRGLDVATGEYVTFVDGDDWIACGGYEAAMAGAEEDVDIIHFGTHLDSWGDTEEARNLEKWFSCQLSEGRSSLPIHYWVMNSNVTNKLYRRELIEKYVIRFPENVAYAEDLAFHYCYASVARLVFTLKTKIYHYVHRSGSAIGTLLQDTERGVDHLTAVKYVVDFIALRKKYARLPSEIIQGFFMHMYSQAKRFVPADRVAGVYEVAWNIALRLGMLKKKNHWLAQELLSHRFGRGKFYRFVHNRDVFCLFGLPFFSISHYESSTVYRFLGCKIYEQCN